MPLAKTMTINSKLLLPLALFAALAGCQGGGSAKAEDDHAGHDHAAAESDDHAGHDHGPGEDAHGEEGHEEGTVALTSDQAKTAGIETQIVTSTEIQSSLTTPGTITATSSGKALVTPTVAGRLVTLSVSLGQKVVRGQQLGTIESTELAEAWNRISEAKRQQEAAHAQLKDQESQVKLAASKVAASTQTLTRQKQLVKAGAFNQAPLQAAQSELNDAQSDLLSAQKEQASHAEELRRTEALYKDGLVSRSELEAARLEIQQDEIRMNREKARVNLAQIGYEREKRIAEQGLLNSREVQTAEADLRSAKLELERSRIALRSTRDAFASSAKAVTNATAAYRTYSGGASASGGRVSLISPLAGVITHLDVTRGQAVDRTQALFEIEDLTQVWAAAQVPEKDASLISKGARVMVTAQALPGRTFAASVQTLASSIDSKTRTLAVQCLVPNPQGLLKPGMFVSVDFAGRTKTKGISVPAESVIEEGGKSFVFVQHDKEFHREEVKLGSKNGTQVQILSGLEAGENLVVKGAFILKSQLKKDELKGHEH
jgi:membrane fusion protein, heavy metal efflux system